MDKLEVTMNLYKTYSEIKVNKTDNTMNLEFIFFPKDSDENEKDDDSFWQM